jgi:hypothetical protein
MYIKIRIGHCHKAKIKLERGGQKKREKSILQSGQLGDSFRSACFGYRFEVMVANIYEP